MSVPKIDDSRWPLVTVDWVGHVTLEEIDTHFDEMAVLAGREGRFAVVVDMRDVTHQTAKHRRRAADKLETLSKVAEQSVICAAHVVGSSLELGVLTALYWLSSPPFETKVFTRRAAAEAWASGKLEVEMGEAAR
jgi:hypothetical protein